mgnify:CR=1 FL=1
MNTIYDVQQFLKRFGIFFYLFDRLADLEMMQSEIMELHKSNLIEKEDFQMALLLLRRDIALEKEKRQ